MSYAGIDCSFPFHPKIRALTDAEYRVHSTAIIYANEHLTDGLITREVVDMFKGFKPKVVQSLVDRGLWRLHDDGWILHDYLDWNKSRAEIEAFKAAKSRAGRAGAAATHGQMP
jgi:hypothetical protein